MEVFRVRGVAGGLRPQEMPATLSLQHPLPQGQVLLVRGHVGW